MPEFETPERRKRHSSLLKKWLEIYNSAISDGKTKVLARTMASKGVHNYRLTTFKNRRGTK